MRIAVTDLTRMQYGYVCVAGVDVETGRRVRPVLRKARLPSAVLARYGGPFDMATVVELGVTEPMPTKPEVEDHAFTHWRARRVDQIDPTLFWEMLRFLAKPSLGELFGPDLRRYGSRGAAVEVERGQASLGCLVPSRPPRLYCRSRDNRASQVRLEVTDGQLDLDLGVADIRLYAEDHLTPHPDLVQRVSRSIAGGAGVVLSVGLTRPFSPTPDQPAVHWLQANNLHLEDDPAWRLG
jgi:hypothetical protein